MDVLLNSGAKPTAPDASLPAASATPLPPAGSQGTAAPPPGPLRGRLALILVPMGLGAALFALGHPAGAVLGLLGGTALIGLEIISRLGGGGGDAA
jgi:hypothetical protein